MEILGERDSGAHLATQVEMVFLERRAVKVQTENAAVLAKKVIQVVPVSQVCPERVVDRECAVLKGKKASRSIRTLF